MMLITNICFVFLLTGGVDEVISKTLVHKIFPEYIQPFDQTVKAANSDEIVGGDEVDIKQFPYQVSVLLMGDPWCGGSLISEIFILTAAHCFVTASQHQLHVGSSLVKDGGRVYKVAEIIAHPNYRLTTELSHDYDIGVMRASSKIIIDGVTTKLVHLPDSNSHLKTGDNIIVSGWGHTKDGGVGSNVLRAVTVPVTSWDSCQKAYPEFLTERMVCAGFDLGGKDSCQGDSGGPAVEEKSLVQYGIVSFGYGCAKEGYPGVYSYIPPLRDWIKQVTGVYLYDCVESAESAEACKDVKKKQKALAKICLSVGPSALQHVRNATTPYEAWTNLQRAYEDKGLCRRLGLLRSLFGAKLSGAESMQSYLSHITELGQQLEDIGSKLEDEFLAVEQQRRDGKTEHSDFNALVMKKTFKSFKCFRCKKTGHFKKDCPEGKKNQKSDKSLLTALSANIQKNVCYDCRKREDFVVGFELRMLYIFNILLLIGGAFNVALARNHGRHIKPHDGGKIVGGEEVTINEYPYQVYLLIQIGINYYACGGSIISANYVLTAAHCLVGASRVYIRAGSTDSDSGGKMYSTSVYTIHPQYNPQTSDYDIAVIKLLRKMTLDGTTTKAVQLPSSDTQVVPRENVIVTGWGATSEGGDTTNILNAVTVPVTTPEFCNQSYSGGITVRMICAGTEDGGKDSCQGDSGGPAVNETSLVQYGVVSFGIGCARPNVPGVYTSVPALRDWIKKTTGV
ncbi:uncharacterized protein LOC135309703 [Plodia interpunctella]|uniref:uncharacterized protein LOC135309703 n=1 Tax=Plodia interpunctella TaxID=58824 RepID=UPI003100CB29